jgi:RNA polymerase sigma factor (sigma-70 family)
MLTRILNPVHEERTDEQLLTACRGGDEGAWEALVLRYQRLVYAVSRRAGLDEDAAAEVFQDVFAALLESLDKLEQPDRLHAWLVTTAKRKTWRMIGRANRMRSFVEAGEEGAREDEMLSLPDETLLPDAALEQLERQHLVRTALAALDERCRTLLTLLFYREEPPPYFEIAAMLGTSEGSIGPTRARCLKKLLEKLKQEGL